MLVTFGFCLISCITVSFFSICSSSAMVLFIGCLYCTRTCPQKLKIFWLTVSWNPFVNARVTIITATLIVVATIERRMMNREKDLWRLNAIRLAIKLATLNGWILSLRRCLTNKSSWLKRFILFFSEFHNMFNVWSINSLYENFPYAMVGDLLCNQ